MDFVQRSYFSMAACASVSRRAAPRLATIILIWFAAANSGFPAEPTLADIYVSTQGNDDWSGRLEAPNADESDGPFATIERARHGVRSLKTSQNSPWPIRVLIRGGHYELRETLKFTPEDTGTKNQPITYAAYPGERPVLSGGLRITGWKLQPGGIWTAEVPDVKAGKLYFQQLFVDGKRQPRARTPDAGTFRTAGPLAAYDRNEQSRRDPKTKLGFKYREGDLKRFTNLDDVQLVVYHSWTASRHHIASIDPAERTVHFTAPSGWPIGWWEYEQRYYVDNVREGLDAPGEWYLDRSAGVVSYLPPHGQDPNKVEIIAARLPDVLRLEGSPEKEQYVEHLVFEGLTFAHADWSLGQKEPCDGQAAAFLKTAAVFARGARDCIWRNCEIAHTGGYGLWLERGCRGCRATQCHLHDLGAGGVRIGEMSLPAEPLRAEHNSVSDSFIHDGGNVYEAGIGVWLGKTSKNRVDHNEICDLNYTGVSVGWTWGYDEPSHAHDNTIEFNHIHHLGRNQLSDMGGVYTLGVSPGTKVINNVIHDVKSYDYGGWGLYPDEGSTGILFENNIVYLTKSGGFHQHYGRDNIVRNNVFADSVEGQIIRSLQEPHTSFRFEHNIVSYRTGDLLAKNWSDGHFVLDYNLYWNSASQPVVFPGDLDLTQWQARGQDQHSLVADPQFVDPEHFDFTLKPSSPALKLGFQPINTKLAGVSTSAELRDLARQIQRPPTEFAPPPGPEPISDDFESTSVGQHAAGATTSGEERAAGASIRVTDEQAATGKHSLEFTDAAGLKHSWQPHLYYKPMYRQGRARMSFDLRWQPGATLVCEWRDDAQPYKIGPSLRVDTGGQLFAGQKSLAKLPDGWAHLEIECGLGRQADGKYRLSVTLPNQKPQVFADLSCGNPAFRSLRWLGFTSLATERVAFYVDNVRLDLEKP